MRLSIQRAEVPHPDRLPVEVVERKGRLAAGRRNRVGGLITPYRSMTMESAAGKNPVSHVGKLYAVAAHEVARALVERLAGVERATCLLASRTGEPVRRPHVVDVRLGLTGGESPATHRRAVEEILAAELEGVPTLWKRLLAREIPLF